MRALNLNERSQTYRLEYTATLLAQILQNPVMVERIEELKGAEESTFGCGYSLLRFNWGLVKIAWQGEVQKL